MQIRSFRGSGEPARVIALSNARDGLGPDPRRALGPAAIRAGVQEQAGHVTAPDQCCRNVKKFLPGRRPHVTLSDVDQFSFTVACHRVGERHEDALSEFRTEREEEV